MSAPRLEIYLGKVHHNARTLVDRLAKRGISVTGVAKAALSSPEIAHAMLLAGVSDLGDSRIENIEAMRRSDVPARMSLIRPPMISQAKRVVTSTDVSFNAEIAFGDRCAQRRPSHGLSTMGPSGGDFRRPIPC